MYKRIALAWLAVVGGRAQKIHLIPIRRCVEAPTVGQALLLLWRTQPRYGLMRFYGESLRVTACALSTVYREKRNGVLSCALCGRPRDRHAPADRESRSTRSARYGARMGAWRVGRVAVRDRRSAR